MITQQLKELNPFKNVDFSLHGDWKITAGVQAGDNLQIANRKFGLFTNLCSFTLLGREGGKMVYPSSRIFGYTQMNQGISGGIYYGGSISSTSDVSFEGEGSVNEKIEKQLFLQNKADVGIKYLYDTNFGINTISMGYMPQFGLLIGFEGDFILKISW